MSRLSDLLDMAALDAAIRDGLVARRAHPTEPLAILNYTARCQRGMWNAVTTQCRGLIYNTQTDEIVARPFRKFFNYGQQEAAEIESGSPVIVTDKLDGSLGILYPIGTGHAVATRGSFESEQARHASELWSERHASFSVPTGWTLLFEIIYPGNRIVLDYGVRDELVLLGAVEISTGRSVSPSDAILSAWNGARAEVFAYSSFMEALSAPTRPNAEGLVIHLPATEARVKIKQEDYVSLHKIVMGLNERSVWEHLRSGKAIEELLGALPDEFHAWTRSTAARILASVDGRIEEVERAFAEIVASLPSDHTRKDFALLAIKTLLSKSLFSRLDGKDYRPGVWDEFYPTAQGPRGEFSEDTA